jgi:hypothetical protein
MTGLTHTPVYSYGTHRMTSLYIGKVASVDVVTNVTSQS